MPTTAGITPSVRFRALVARERELAFIDERLAAARKRAGAALVLTAPAGTGKSRILAAVTARPGARDYDLLAARALVGTWITSPAKADQYDSSTFHVAFSDESDTVCTTSRFRRLIASAVRGATAERPALVILDDAQSADESTLRMLARLAPKIAELPVVVIVSLRSDDRALRPGLARAAQRIEDSLAGHALSLAPLDDAALSQALAAASRDVAPLPDEVRCTILSRAAGNPYAAEELLRSWIARGAGEHRFVPPPTVSASIIERAGRLGRAAQKILRSCSAIGPLIDVDLLASVANVAIVELDEAIRELCNAQMLSYERRLGYAHEIVQEAIASTFLAGEARTLHRAVVCELRERSADPIRIARHAVLARDAYASMLAEAAGDLLASRKEHPEAIPFYEAARGAALAPDTLGPLLEKLARAYEASDEHARALDVALEAARLIADAGDLDRALDVAVSALRLAQRSSDPTKVVAVRELIEGWAQAIS